MDSVEQTVAKIFSAAIYERRSIELWECLCEGGSATVDRITGKLVTIPPNEISRLAQELMDKEGRS